MAYIEYIQRKKGLSARIRYSRNGVKYSETYGYKESAKFLTEREFKKWIDKRALELDLGEKAILQNNITVEELLNKFINNKKNNIDTNVYLVASKHLIKYVGKGYKASNINHHVIHELRDWLLENREYDKSDKLVEQRIKRGINKYLKHIVMIFRWAYKQDIIDSHFYDKIEYFKTSEPAIEYLSKSEIRKISAQLPKYPESKMKLLFYIFLYTGLRREEILQLNKSKIDKSSRTVHLTLTKNFTEDDIRIPRKPFWRLLDWVNIEEPICPYHEDSISTAFRRAFKKAGITKTKPVHILRHTFVTNFIIETSKNSDYDRAFFMAKNAAGHKSFKMTNRYTHILKKELAQNV